MALRIVMPQAPIMRRVLVEVRKQIIEDMRVLMGRIADEALERVKELTPVDTGQTREKWRLFILNREPGGSGSGRSHEAFFAAIDHPYNKPGAGRWVRNDFGKRVRQIVNRGDGNSLLTDLEYGTKEHVIVPKPPRKFLRFQIGDKVVFTKKVRHPGTRALNMTRTAAAEAQKKADAGLRIVLSRAVAKLEEIR